VLEENPKETTDALVKFLSDFPHLICACGAARTGNQAVFARLTNSSFCHRHSRRRAVERWGNMTRQGVRVFLNEMGSTFSLCGGELDIAP